MTSISGYEPLILGQTIQWGRFLGFFDLRLRDSPDMNLKDFWHSFVNRHCPGHDQSYIASPAANIAYLFMVISFVRDAKDIPGLDRTLDQMDLAKGIEVIAKPCGAVLNLRYVIRRLRNALAHGAYTWEPTGLRLTDTNPGNASDRFDVRLGMDSLSRLAEALLETVAAKQTATADR
ncbi:MAG: hypothetical protein AB7V26_03315 [Lysobacterales bacterium]